MPGQEEAYNTAAIRRLLIAAFTPEELRRFCRDRPLFCPIVDRFGPNHGLDDMVDEVLEYCGKGLLLGELLDKVKGENPRQYERGGPYLLAPGEMAAVLADIEADRVEYLEYLRCRLEYLDLGGIAPKVANRTVKLPTMDLYVSVEAWRELDTKEGRQQMQRPGEGARPEGVRETPDREELLKQFPGLLPYELEPRPPRLKGTGRGPTTASAREPATMREILTTPRAVLLGHPGTGKSTMLKFVAYAIAAGLGDLVGGGVVGRLPVVVRLVDYARLLAAEPDLRLGDYLRNRHDPSRAPLFRHYLGKGGCLVMLDGLDEVIDAHQRAEIADQVEELVAACPGNHYLITSRIVGYQAGWLTGDFAHFTLGPLPEASIRGFVTKWYEAIERESGGEAADEIHDRAEELCRVIDERPGIRRLAENPLLLTIIALVNWKGRRLPNRRVELYRHATETLVESWPYFRRGMSFNGEEVLSLLEPVAYRIFGDRSSDEIGEAELLPLLAEAVAAAKPGVTAEAARDYAQELLPRLSEHSGLFLERGFDPDRGGRVFGFLHLTFAEYLAARCLARRWEAMANDGERRAWLAGYAQAPRWREVVLLLAGQVGLDGRCRAATQLLADLLEMDLPYEEHLHRGLLLAGQCLADDLRVEPEAADWVLDHLAELAVETPIGPLFAEIAVMGRAMASTAYDGKLADRLVVRLKKGSEEMRYMTAEALGAIRSKRGVDELLAMLRDESMTLRTVAAWALGAIRSERAVDGLLEALRDESKQVQDKAAWALEEIRGERAVDGLLAALQDEREEVRSIAAGALGVIRSERAVDGLMAALRDKNAQVCDMAAEALRGIGNERAVDALLAALPYESWEIDELIVKLLERFPTEWMAEAMAPLLDVRSKRGRSNAIAALGEIRSERSVDGLLAVLQDKDAGLREMAAGALGAIGSERAVDGLLAMLHDESKGVRGMAAWALGVIQDERAVGGLLVALQDESRRVCALAAWALGLIRSELAVDGLLATVRDKHDPWVQHNAVGALGEIRSQRAVDGLLAALRDESEYVRQSATVGLGKIQSQRVVDGLLVALQDESRSVRSAAARALRAIQSERTVEGLLVALQDESEWVREYAAEALGFIESERTVGGLLTALRDESEQVRGKAAEALGAIGSERAVDGLLPVLRDENEDVRRRAAMALEEIGSERAVAGLMATLLDENTQVRGDAASALGAIQSEQAVQGLLPWLSGTEWSNLVLGEERACDWAYRTIVATLARHASDPAIVARLAGEGTAVAGPWRRGVDKK